MKRSKTNIAFMLQSCNTVDLTLNYSI